MTERLTLQLGNSTREISITSAVDKIDGFIYYTLAFDPENWVVLSRFDGDHWRIANRRLNDTFAEWLGSIVDDQSSI